MRIPVQILWTSRMSVLMRRTALPSIKSGQRVKIVEKRGNSSRVCLIHSKFARAAAAERPSHGYGV